MVKTFSLLFLLFDLLLVNSFLCSCEHMATNPESEECDPLAFVDTTRTYSKYYSGGKDTLSLVTDVVHAAFDTNMADATIDSLFAEYELNVIGRFSVTTSGKKFLLYVPKGKRAEEFFTFYDVDTDCGFGNQDGVIYSTPVFWAFPHLLPADSSILMLTDEFFAEVDTNKLSLEQLDEVNKERHVEFVRQQPYRPDVVILRVT